MRQANAEQCAIAPSGAFGTHRSAVQFDDVADDREPDAEPGVRTRRAGVGLPKPLEHLGQQLGCDPLAVVAHDQFDLVRR